MDHFWDYAGLVPIFILRLKITLKYKVNSKRPGFANVESHLIQKVFECSFGGL